MSTEWVQIAASAISIAFGRLKAWTPRVRKQTRTRETVVEVTRTTRATWTETTVEK